MDQALVRLRKCLLCQTHKFCEFSNPFEWAVSSIVTNVNAASINSSDFVFANPQTVGGTAGNDTLVGGLGDDTIAGLDGDDVISGDKGQIQSLVVVEPIP